MNSRQFKMFALIACVGCLVATSATSTEAGIIPFVWDVLFGPCDPACRGGGYAPVCSTPSSYACAPSYNNCGTCYAPANYVCNPCPPAVACAPASPKSAVPAPRPVAPLDQGWTPSAKGAPQTYAPETKGNDAKPAGGAAEGAAEEIRNRTRAETGLDATGKDRLQDDEDDAAGFQKPDRAAGSGAGEGDSSDGSSDPSSRPVNKKAPPTSKIPEETRTRPIVPLELDSKIVWRPAAKRSRVALGSRTADARIVRVPEYARSSWRSEGSPSAVASN
jgi:hypothetical protein